MPISRTFLDWSQPALPAVAEYLIQRYGQDEQLNLENVLLVLPGRRAGRRLLELLVESTEESHPDFIPPEMVTASSLPEKLYEPMRTFATKSVERLAWYEALRKTDRKAIRAYAPNPPDDGDFSGWMSLADQLLQLHRDLLADQVDFSAVAPAGRGLTGFDRSEERRWNVLDTIQKRYLAILDEQLVWDLQTARKIAVEKREVATDQDVILIGSVDLNRTMRSMLDLVADRVTALVHAPEDQSPLFDDYGCLVAKKWQDVAIDLVDEQVHIVERHTNQARQVVDCLAGYNGQFSADEITIGVTDEALVPYLQRHLAASDVSARWVVEKTIGETGPYRLLQAIAAFLESNGNRDNESSWWQAVQFASMVRHPDLEQWLHGRPCFQSGELHRNWLPQLDQYMAEHLQPVLGFWLGNSNRCDSLKAVYDEIEQLLQPVQVRNDRRSLVARPLTKWCDAIREVLLSVYGEQTLDKEHPVDRIVIHSMEAIFEALAEQSHIPKDIEPSVNSGQALQMLLDAVSQNPIPPLPDDEAVEMLGWLELPLDDAPALVITNFNEGFVPDSVTSDTFLPNNLRLELGLGDNDQRYARDAYVLTAMLNSRKDLQLIIGRRDSRDDPMKPSRLLFATEPESIAGRVLSFLEPKAAAVRDSAHEVADAEEADTEEADLAVHDAETPGVEAAGSQQKTFSFGGDDEDDPVAEVTGPSKPAKSAAKSASKPTAAESAAEKFGHTPLRLVDGVHSEPPNPFVVPEPERGEPLTAIGVTSFKKYLQSPYRFYLSHVKQLRGSDDRLREMDPMGFGNLIHEVLERFGNSDAKDSTSTKEITAELISSMDLSIEKTLGRYRTAAVNVQIEQMRQRLHKFAAWQAGWAGEGWKIYYAEEKGQQFTVDLDLAKGQSVTLKGRIDRIDKNVRTGEFAILDYKTGDSVQNPAKTHQKNGEWVDLQLPLYTLLAEPLGVTGSPQLGYIALPAKLEEVGEKIADWSEDDVAEALEVARHIAFRIVNQDFRALENHNVLSQYDEFGRICQTTVRSDA